MFFGIFLGLFLPNENEAAKKARKRASKQQLNVLDSANTMNTA